MIKIPRPFQKQEEKNRHIYSARRASQKLGSFDNENFKSFKALDIQGHRATMLSKQLVSGVIRVSKDIYYIKGRRKVS